MATEEPRVTRYRFVEGHAEKLEYPSGIVRLSFCGNRGDYWVLYATKENDPNSFLEIMRRPTMLEWATARFEGFDVPTGSPADKIMQKLVRQGDAVLMAPGERFWSRRAARKQAR
jgi:hypothetical protein